MTELFTIDITAKDKLRIKAGLELLANLAKDIKHPVMEQEVTDINDLIDEVDVAGPLVETVAPSAIADVLTERDRQIIAGALGFAGALVIANPALADGVQGADFNELRALAGKMDLV